MSSRLDLFGRGSDDGANNHFKGEEATPFELIG